MERYSYIYNIIILLVIISVFFYMKRETFVGVPIEKNISTNNFLDVNTIVKFVINRINVDLGLNYEIIGYNEINMEEYLDSTRRFLLKIFLHNSKFHNSKEVLMDIVDLYGTGNLKLISIVSTNSNKLNELPQTTSNLIKYKNMSENPKGNLDINLDYSYLDIGLNDKNKEDYRNTIRHRELRLSKLIGLNAYPCRKTGKWWDNNGVKDIDIFSKNCRGINSSTVKRELLGTFNPNIIDKRISVNSSLEAEKCLTNLF